MEKKIKPAADGFNEILLYTTPNGKVKVEIYLQNETIWLSQQKIADLFGVQRPAVTKHLKNIFDTGELQEEVVSSILEHTTQHGAMEGKTQEKKVKFYNLDAIISVGYRVNSTQATDQCWILFVLFHFFDDSGDHSFPGHSKLVNCPGFKAMTR